MSVDRDNKNMSSNSDSDSEILRKSCKGRKQMAQSDSDSDDDYVPRKKKQVAKKKQSSDDSDSESGSGSSSDDEESKDDYNVNGRKDFYNKANKKYFCRGVKRTFEPCIKYCVGKTLFCKTHKEFVEYTPEQLKELIRKRHVCTGCLNVKYLPVGGLCDVCKVRKTKNRKITKKKTVDDRAICKNPVCDNKIKADMYDYDDYCRYCQRFGKLTEMKAKGLKICVYFEKRRCGGSVAKNSEFKTCDKCRTSYTKSEGIYNTSNRQKRKDK